jgi:orotate phosphoribosyltransferase
VRSEGAELVGVVTVIDRQEGAAEAFAAAGLTLTAILTLQDFK